MASSLYRKWSQIVRLIPCSSNSEKEIFAVVKSVISEVERCGLIVQVICTDNYPLNVSFFKLFSSDNKNLTPVIHPNDAERSFCTTTSYTLSNQLATTGSILKIMNLRLSIQIL